MDDDFAFDLERMMADIDKRIADFKAIANDLRQDTPWRHTTKGDSERSWTSLCKLGSETVALLDMAALPAAIDRMSADISRCKGICEAGGKDVPAALGAKTIVMVRATPCALASCAMRAALCHASCAMCANACDALCF